MPLARNFSQVLEKVGHRTLVHVDTDNVLTAPTEDELTDANPGLGGGGGPVEGTAVLSTGEAGGTKFLREDGDGTCSWQSVAGGNLDVGTSAIANGTDKGVFFQNGASPTGTLAQDIGFTYDIATATLTATNIAGDGSGLTGLPSGDLVVGTTGVTSGTDTKILFNNAGTLGEYTVGTGVATALGQNVSGSGSIALTGAPTFTGTTIFADITYSSFLKSTTAAATPGALSATQFTAFASTTLGATLMGYGTTYDAAILNRAGTTVLGVTANTTGLVATGALNVAGVLTQTGNIELNHATQNTLSGSAGVLSIEGHAVATVDQAQTITAAYTFRVANAIRSEAASTQDAIVVAGRAGGTSSFAVTLVPATLAASVTATLPAVTGTVVVAATSTTATQAMFATATAGAPAFRAIAATDVPHSLTFALSGGGSALTTGVKDFILNAKDAGTVTGWSMSVSPADTITVDILRSADGGAAPSSSIVGAGTKPAIASGVNAHNTPASWTSTTISAYDNFKIQITAVGGTATSATLTLYYQ